MKKSEKFEQMVDLAKQTEVSIMSLESNSGTYSKAIETDLVKTTKAMFYEKFMEILNKE